MIIRKCHIRLPILPPYMCTKNLPQPQPTPSARTRHQASKVRHPESRELKRTSKIKIQTHDCMHVYPAYINKFPPCLPSTAHAREKANSVSHKGTKSRQASLPSQPKRSHPKGLTCPIPSELLPLDLYLCQVYSSHPRVHAVKCPDSDDKRSAVSQLRGCFRWRSGVLW